MGVVFVVFEDGKTDGVIKMLSAGSRFTWKNVIYYAYEDASAAN